MKKLFALVAVVALTLTSIGCKKEAAPPAAPSGPTPTETKPEETKPAEPAPAPEGGAAPAEAPPKQ